MTTEDDPLLAALADAAQRKQRADRDIRLLLAYAREHVQPVRARLHVRAGGGEQQPDLMVGLLFARCGVGQRGEQWVLSGHDACRHFGDSRAIPEGMT